MIYCLWCYSVEIVKYVNDLRNPTECSDSGDVCEYVIYCQDHTLLLNDNTIRLKEMFTASYFSVILVQIIRIIYTIVKDRKSNYISIYMSSMVVMIINFSAEYLNISRNQNVHCTDVNGVTLPVIFFVEWHITLPAMIYLVLSLDSEKTKLSLNDYSILISGAYTIITSILCNLVSNEIVGGILIASSIASLSFLVYNLINDSKRKLKHITAQKEGASLNPQQYIQVSFLSRKLECSYFLAVLLPVFGSVYILQYSHILSVETSQLFLHFANVISKIGLNIFLCEAHLEMLNPREYNLITEKKANCIKRSFIRYIFHEVRSPLNSILIGLSTLIKDEELKTLLSNSKSGSSIYEVMYLMKESASNLGETLNDVLNLQKIEEDILKLNVSSFKTFSITNTIEANYGDVVSDKSLNFKVIYKQGIPLTIIGDEDFLKHAILNIVSNACSFTAKNGNIVVVLDIQHDKRNFLINILDDGISVRQSDIGTLFLPYATLNTSIKRQERALGIGLAISHDIIELHGGTIQYNLSKGETMYGMTPQGIFTIVLPIRNTSCDYLLEEKIDLIQIASTPSESVEKRSIATKSDTNELCFLIVDDVRSNWKILQMLVTKRNIKSDIAENGVDAVEMVRKDCQKYQIIFMDNMMPKMTGVEATKLIRLAGFEGIIMGLTGNTLEKDIEEFEQAGATLVLPKPLNHRHLDKLLSLINSATIHELLPSKILDIRESFKDVY